MGIKLFDCIDLDEKTVKKNKNSSDLLAADALPFPVRLADRIFVMAFFLSSYYLLRRCGSKNARILSPFRILSFGDMAAVVSLIASLIYLLGFFGIDYVQKFIGRTPGGRWGFGEKSSGIVQTFADSRIMSIPRSWSQWHLQEGELKENNDEDIACAVSRGAISSHTLETSLDDAYRAASIRRRAAEHFSGRSLQSLPLDGFDYSSIVGQCCELVIGHVQLPLGIAGPLLLDGLQYMVPMATTEGCLVASTNRGCKAIYYSGGATSILLRDGMTRAPVVRFQRARRAAELKLYVEDSSNYDTLSTVFNRFGRLQNIRCMLAGRNLYVRFSCSTGDAMGMNMVSKGVQNVLLYLQTVFPDMEIVSLSGNLCADKKATAMNWINGRGKSVVCEAVIPGDVVKKILKTSVSNLVELNAVKNLAGSALAGAMGGFNAHAANVVSAIFIATGQDPAQNVESSHCLTMMEAVNEGCDLHATVTMPSIEVGTIGGGTQLASQSACLNLLGIKGANSEIPGSHAQTLARIVAGAVLAGELSLMSALAAGHLVKSHMKYNRSNKSLTEQSDGRNVSSLM